MTFNFKILFSYCLLWAIAVLLSCNDNKMNTTDNVEVEAKPALSPLELAIFEYKNSLEENFKKVNVKKEKVNIFLEAFKAERELNLWIKNEREDKYQLFRSYPFAGFSGTLGPKRKEGDRQIPEGYYHINRFNPKSKFYLSLGINYPNEDDLKYADKEQPGSDIFIHGSTQTVGCIPITDKKIRELYLIATWATEAGQSQIPVHIYPFKKTTENYAKYSKQYPQHQQFWKELMNF